MRYIRYKRYKCGLLDPVREKQNNGFVKLPLSVYLEVALTAPLPFLPSCALTYLDNIVHFREVTFPRVPKVS